MNKVKAAFCYYLLMINIITFILFALDKFRATSWGAGGKYSWPFHRYRRTSETVLLSYAALGGTLAAFGAQRLFRHKTRKQPFGSRLVIIAWIQIILLSYYFLST
jgi:uncharacterized membrane protein YsdA (DUF1294 family)